ncbi:hypothetical protein ACFQ23_10395 [Schaalia naturae]|uniref:Transcriptional regulator n=1 Tax=Schaalia naturae TaxID=635203 RepID=A0ABW2SQD9_9ACTO
MSVAALAAERPGRERARMRSARQTVLRALEAGATVSAAAARAGISAEMAGVMVDEMRRSGLLVDAASLCASGLGACHSAGGLAGASEEVRVHCAGCPMIPLRPRGNGVGSRRLFARLRRGNPAETASR